MKNNYIRGFQRVITIIIVATNITIAQNQILIPYFDVSKYGYCNINQEIIIKPEFDEALFFKYGIAPVRKNGKYGFIDNKGNIIVDLKYDKAWEFKNCVARVALTKNLKAFYGYISKEGTNLLSQNMMNLRSLMNVTYGLMELYMIHLGKKSISQPIGLAFLKKDLHNFL